MKHRSGKAKGRRLQVEVAEMLARSLKLTIEAVPPTSPGIKNRATWVSENDHPDLRVRRMSEAGADVALLTDKAQEMVAIHGRPLHIECKNQESWSFDATFWRKAHNAFVDGAFDQTKKIIAKDWAPVIVLSKNRWEPIAVWKPYDELSNIDGAVCLTWNDLAATRLTQFVRLLDGAG